MPSGLSSQRFPRRTTTNERSEEDDDEGAMGPLFVNTIGIIPLKPSMLMDFGMVIRTGLYRGLPRTIVRNPHLDSWRSHRSATSHLPREIMSPSAAPTDRRL